MKKRILTMMMAAALCVSSVPFSVMAEEEISATSSLISSDSVAEEKEHSTESVENTSISTDDDGEELASQEENNAEVVVEQVVDESSEGDDIAETESVGLESTEDFETKAELYAVEDSGIAIDKTHFPDENFRVKVSEYDNNNDNMLSTDEIAKVTNLSVADCSIYSLNGIEYFSKLYELNCSYNKLTSLDVSQNTVLYRLDCSGNQLTSLELSKNTAQQYLYSLKCNGNQLTSLNLGKTPALQNLECYKNQLTSLDLRENMYLESLFCYNNQLASLDLRNNTSLRELYCNNNQLTSFDLSNNTSLRELECNDNQLTSLDASKNTALEYLSCENNQLMSLDMSQNTALYKLYCENNQLTSLDVSKNTALQDLRCNNNQLTSLDMSQNTALYKLYCENNQLTGLDVSKNTALQDLRCNNNQLTSLNVSQNAALYELECQYNQLTNLDISGCPYLVYVYQNGSNNERDNTMYYFGTAQDDRYCILWVDNSLILRDDRIIVVSLGDSYSSGEGIEPFYGQDKQINEKINDEDWLAHRSKNSWPAMLEIPGIDGVMRNYKYDPEKSLEDVQCIWFFKASSGAETKHFNKSKQKKTVRQAELNFEEDKKYLPLQLEVFDQIKEKGLGNVDYVTLSVGGNDVGFADIITTCAWESSYLGSKSAVLRHKLSSVRENLETTEANIRDIYYAIHDRTSPRTKIIVAGYPKLLDVNGKGAAISRKEAYMINSNVTYFNGVISDIIQSCKSDMDISFVDIESKFGTTHQAYSDESWINGIIIGPNHQDLDHKSIASSYSIHPNALGARAYADAVNKTIHG